MATQLTRRRLRDAVKGSAGTPVLNIHPRQAMIAGAAALVAVYASMFAAIHNAQRDDAAAERRYADTRALLAAPPPALDSLIFQRDAAGWALEATRAQLVPPTADLSSDDATAMLIRSAEAAGLDVAAIARIAPAQKKEGTQVYDVQGIRMTVTGSNEQIAVFLQALHSSDPGLLPALAAMSIADDGTAQAEITFSAHTKVAPTPAAGARP